MTKQIDGLCAIIEEQLKMHPDENNLFLFCGRKKDRIKAIYRKRKKHVDEHIFTCYYIYNKNEHKFVRGADIIAFLLYAMYNI